MDKESLPSNERLSRIKQVLPHLAPIYGLPPEDAQWLVAEIERLRAENAKLITDNDAGCMANTQLNRTVERLRAALTISRGQWIHSVNAVQCLQALGESVPDFVRFGPWAEGYIEQVGSQWVAHYADGSRSPPVPTKEFAEGLLRQTRETAAIRVCGRCGKPLLPAPEPCYHCGSPPPDVV